MSYSSPRVTVSHTLMIHMEFMCLFMLSFIWGEGFLEKESSVQNIPKYQWFLKEKKKKRTP